MTAPYEPSTFRQMLEGTITSEEYLEDLEERSSRVVGPTNCTFEDWHAAADAYARSRSDLDWWDFQIKEFASCVAWDWEGAVITPARLDDAYDLFLSGRSRGPHYVRPEGLDMDLEELKYTAEARDRMLAVASESGMWDGEVTRLMTAWEKWHQDSFNTSWEDAKNFLESWMRGFHPDSPHRVPFEPEHLAAREAERTRVLDLPEYRSIITDDVMGELSLMILLDTERPGFPREKPRRSYY